MSRQSITLTPQLHEYLVAHSTPPDPMVTELIEETTRVMGGVAGLQISPEQAALFTFLGRLLGVRNAVEVGTFTGLSSLALALGMAADGKLTCFDISEEYTSIARRYWAKAGVADRIELRLGDAATELPQLPAGPYLDFAFIDADKGGYATYWAELVPRLRPGGVLAVDNVLWSGRVLRSPAERDPDTAAIIAFNEMALADDRVEIVMLPIGDGITLARKR